MEGTLCYDGAALSYDESVDFITKFVTTRISRTESTKARDNVCIVFEL